VESALHKLNSFRITSGPVLENNKNILGLLGVEDLMAFLVKICTKTLIGTKIGESKKLTTDDPDMVIQRTNQFKLSSVKELIDYSQKNPYVTLYEDQTAKEAMEIFGSKGIHRIVLLKKSDDTISGILSQTNLVLALANEPSLKQCQAPVSEMKNKTTGIVTVSENELTINAYIKMDENNVSSLAVVNQYGQLAGNLSGSDLRDHFDLVLGETFAKLLKPVKDWLHPIRKSQGRAGNFVLSCSPETSLQEAVLLMAKERVHRIYTVDRENFPLAVISTTDIVREMREYPSFLWFVPGK
jgi:CBS domain-containing protein